MPIWNIKKIIKSLNSNKATNPDKIPPKLVKLAANIIDPHLSNILNQSISSSTFSEQAKIAEASDRYTAKTKEKKLKNTDLPQFYHLSQKSMKCLFKSLHDSFRG